MIPLILFTSIHLPVIAITADFNKITVVLYNSLLAQNTTPLTQGTNAAGHT
jgi:hypothetical protein